jgi:translocation and assembly module TamA
VFLFRTGGDNTVRGYAYQSLGVEENGAIVGGRYMAVGSAEYTRWLTREWGAAVFYDTGNAADSLSKFKTVNGYGGGVRWASPFGRLALDIAYGEATHKLRLHFSVGVSFR